MLGCFIFWNAYKWGYYRRFFSTRFCYPNTPHRVSLRFFFSQFHSTYLCIYLCILYYLPLNFEIFYMIPKSIYVSICMCCYIWKNEQDVGSFICNTNGCRYIYVKVKFLLLGKFFALLCMHCLLFGSLLQSYKWKNWIFTY